MAAALCSCAWERCLGITKMSLFHSSSKELDVFFDITCTSVLAKFEGNAVDHRWMNHHEQFWHLAFGQTQPSIFFNLVYSIQAQQSYYDYKQSWFPFYMKGPGKTICIWRQETNLHLGLATRSCWPGSCWFPFLKTWPQLLPNHTYYLPCNHDEGPLSSAPDGSLNLTKPVTIPLSQQHGLIFRLWFVTCFYLEHLLHVTVLGSRPLCRNSLVRIPQAGALPRMPSVKRGKAVNGRSLICVFVWTKERWL